MEVKKLANDKEVVEPCKTCDVLTKEVDSLKCNASKLQDEALNSSKFKESSIALDDMLSHQKMSQDKEGLGFSKNDKTTLASPDKPIYAQSTVTGNRRLFTSYKAYDGGHVIFRSNLKVKVVDGAKNTFEGDALDPWIPALEQGGARTMRYILLFYKDINLLPNDQDPAFLI
ncbi:hypothetical protein Tco_0772412 [Tanacetum coccineum]|uniref:Uncharacterized protein n=1 Tax=Tanacetum coccineum TaxID=301880 RepID=A0ABQ4ZKE7_9ASTR